jgi:CBS domain containing-hemolysin-like protein
MFSLLYILIGVLAVVLILLAAVRPAHTTLSMFELRRRVKLRDRTAEEVLAREEILAQLSLLNVPIRALLIVVITLLSVYVFGWSEGSIIALAIALLYGRIAQFSVVHTLAGKFYRRREQKLLAIMAKYEAVLTLLGGKLPHKMTPVAGSPEEVAHIIESSRIFSSEDAVLLKNALAFRHRQVKDIMIPEKSIVTVQYADLLGPLVLDDLHKTGHTVFPVVKNGRIVGLLDSSDHVALKSKDSVYVYDVMHRDVARVSQTATLDGALHTLIDAQQQLLIVVDDEDKTVGLVGLNDIVRALIGEEQG